MNLFSTTLAAFCLSISAFVGTAHADTYQHIDQLALQIDGNARLLVSESRHYQHTAEYRHLLADAREICALASHIHELAHHHGSLAHLESDVAELDSEFHHLESVFDRVEQQAAHGYGHVHGNTTHVRQLLNAIADGIHHLQDDLRSLRTPVHAVQRVIAPRPSIYASPSTNNWGGFYGQPQSSGFGFGGGYNGNGTHGQGTHGFGSGGRGITIGGGSSRFTIRF